jgi:hypothetical protein
MNVFYKEETDLQCYEGKRSSQEVGLTQMSEFASLVMLINSSKEILQFATKSSGGIAAS